MPSSLQYQPRWFFGAVQGAGLDRFLQIAKTSEGLGNVSLTEDQRRHAMEIWNWCQLEGGPFWSYSQDEIKGMLATGEDFPENLQWLCTKM